MKSYLKKKKVRIESLDEEFEIRALSASEHTEVSDAQDRGRIESIAVCCKYGVIEWNDETPESVAENVTTAALTELATKIYEISGFALAKNSESATDDDSS